MARVTAMSKPQAKSVHADMFANLSFYQFSCYRPEFPQEFMLAFQVLTS